MHPIVFLDFETTGMSPEGDGVTDIGLVRVEPDGTREAWEQLVNPGRWIPSQITALTGISNEMVAHAPGFGGVADELARRVGGALVVAHNAKFDLGFLNAGFRRSGVDLRVPHVCSVRVARKLFPALKSRSLDSLSGYFGLRFEGARHRALPDTLMLERLWHAMRDAVGDEAFEKTVAALICDGPVEMHCGLEIADCGSKISASSKSVTATPPNPQSAIPNPQLPSWPYPGPVVMKSTRREGEWHVFHEWRHLGTVSDESEITIVVETRRDHATFVESTYRRIVTAFSTPGVEIRLAAVVR